MANVQFEEESQYAARRPSGTTPKMAAKLISLGLVKNEKQASYILIGIAIIALLLSAYLISSKVLPANVPLDAGELLLETPV